MTQKATNLLRNPPNLNLFWGALVVEELIRNGVENFFISPGSHSTPITWAVADNPRAKSIVHVDERGAAYCALGTAKSSGRPAAVVCTSGTAAANFFPAVVEAAMSFIPLILITADRPPELSDAGANQTIDQINMFGKYPRWFINLPCPNPQMPGRTVLTAVDQAVYRACNPPAGPVHINLMFREPLAPVETGEPLLEMTAPLVEWEASGAPYTLYDRSEHAPSLEALARLTETVRNAQRGLLIAGQMASPAEADSVLNLARALNWPVFPDVTSGLRLGPDHAPFIHYYDQMLISESFREFCRPDAVIQIGSPYVSKRLQRHLHAFKPRHYVFVANHPYRHDPTHIATVRIESDIHTFCQKLIAALRDGYQPTETSPWREEMFRRNSTCRKAITESLAHCTAGVPPADCGAGVSPAHLCEPAVAHILPSLVPPGATLLFASSMPIRDTDMYAAPTEAPVFATASRGTSGVDGLLATAAGYAHGSGKPVVFELGDLALLHDLNSLALLSKVDAPVIVIAINNFGGAIFSFLPIAAFPEHFEKFWGTPHPYTFKKAAEMFRVPYNNPSTVTEFTAALKTAIESGAPALIEVSSNRAENLKIHQAIQEHIRKTLDAP